MRKTLIILGLLVVQGVEAQGCIRGGHYSQPHYICMDGRTLEATPTGLVWNAKRGCFISSIPCCGYNATHYAYYANPKQIGKAYARCRHDYPQMLGQMQTH